jgi:heat shock protein HspQ
MNVLGRYRFAIGEVVFHKRYRYRGVIVGVDPCCRASDQWYSSNPRQPDRLQPWYHVLVHGGRETYVAQENLVHDWSLERVEHPEVDLRFPTFHKGRYFVQSMN